MSGRGSISTPVVRFPFFNRFLFRRALEAGYVSLWCLSDAERHSLEPYTCPFQHSLFSSINGTTSQAISPVLSPTSSLPLQTADYFQLQLHPPNMQVTRSLLALLAATGASVVFAATFNVTVGLGGLVFNPNQVTAAAGDTISFQL